MLRRLVLSLKTFFSKKKTIPAHSEDFFAINTMAKIKCDISTAVKENLSCL